MQTHEPEEKIDPKLLASLALLRQTPRRDPVAAAQGRAKFLSELEAAIPAQAGSLTWLPPALLTWVTQSQRRIVTMLTLRRTALALTAAILILGVFLFGGFGITAQAARTALPGDALYPVKTGLEQARLAFTRSLAAEVKLNLEFAANRLDEMEKLIEAGRFEEAAEHSQAFHQSVNRALNGVEQMEKVDPLQAAALRTEVGQSLTQFMRQLSELMARLPELIRNRIMENAPVPNLPPVQPGSGNGNENANGNANQNENANSNANGNTNQNENANGNENGNENGNTNFNANQNDNDDDDDRNGNGNGNDNDDDRSGNSNDNDDDRGGNSGSGGNGNDRSGNDNGGDDRGGNDNDRDDDDDDDDDDDNGNSSLLIPPGSAVLITWRQVS